MISVIIPTYNRADYLQEAIESVLGQTYKDFEIIVVDDNSTDNTKEIVSAYKNKIKYIFQENKERAAARNNGIVHAKGEYVAFLDSDDLWLPNHLEACLKTLKAVPDAGLSFSGSYIIDEESNVVSKMKLSRFNGYALRDIVSKYSSGGCNASSCLIRKEIFNKAGYFNEDRALSGSQDWEMWVRIAAVTKLVSTNTYTTMVRFHREKWSINADRMARSMTRALDLVYGNAKIIPKIRDLNRQAYSSLYTVMGINYYASGDMKTARRYLRGALRNNPLSIVTNRYIIYTFLRSLLGHRLSVVIRRTKWALNTNFLR